MLSYECIPTDKREQYDSWAEKNLDGNYIYCLLLSTNESQNQDNIQIMGRLGGPRCPYQSLPKYTWRKKSHKNLNSFLNRPAQFSPVRREGAYGADQLWTGPTKFYRPFCPQHLYSTFPKYNCLRLQLTVSPPTKRRILSTKRRSF